MQGLDTDAMHGLLKQKGGTVAPASALDIVVGRVLREGGKHASPLPKLEPKANTSHIASAIPAGGAG